MSFYYLQQQTRVEPKAGTQQPRVEVQPPEECPQRLSSGHPGSLGIAGHGARQEGDWQGLSCEVSAVQPGHLEESLSGVTASLEGG